MMPKKSRDSGTVINLTGILNEIQTNYNLLPKEELSEVESEGEPPDIPPTFEQFATELKQLYKTGQSNTVVVRLIDLRLLLLYGELDRTRKIKETFLAIKGSSLIKTVTTPKFEEGYPETLRDTKNVLENVSDIENSILKKIDWLDELKVKILRNEIRYDLVL